MSNFKLILSLFATSTLVACAIPEPGKKEIAIKQDGPQLELSDSQFKSKMLSEEYDSEIAVATAKKYQLGICLQGNPSTNTIAEGDVVTLTSDSETRSLKADRNSCIRWQESIEAGQENDKKIIEISRKVNLEKKFSNTLDLIISIHSLTGESTVRLADSKLVASETAQLNVNKSDETLAVATEGLELGFETLAVKVSKTADLTYSLAFEGMATLNGEILRYGRVQGKIIITNSQDGKSETVLKTLDVKGSIKDGALALQIEDNKLSCVQGQISLEVQLAAVSKKYSIKPFRELHALKACASLEGSFNLNEPLKAQ